MMVRNLLGVCLLFLSSVGESLSLKTLAKIRVGSSSLHPPQQHGPGGGGGASVQHVFALRGGQQQQQQQQQQGGGAVETPPSQQQSASPGISRLSAFHTTSITGALTMLGKFYSSSLESAPILTKSMTAAVLFAISDQMAQMLEMQRNQKMKHTNKPLSLAATNKKRSLFSGLVGFFYFGPMAHLWYGWIFATFPGKTMLSILQKAALGQFFFAPPLFCVFFAAALLQNGQFTLGNWVQKIKQDLIKGWLGGLGFWPFINYISYGYVPQKWIPLFINLMGLVFNIYVSLIANLKQKEQSIPP